LDVALKMALDAVVEHLRLEGFRARLAGDCASIGMGQAAVVAQILRLQSAGDLHAAGIWVGLRVRDDSLPLFFDLVTGFGATQDEAVVSAMITWRHGVLPPILPLLGAPKPDEVEVLGTEGGVDIPSWTIYCGPYQVSGPQQDELVRQLAAKPPLGQLRDVLEQQIEKGQLHWLKVFRCKDTESGFDEADCFLDSQQFEPGAALLAQWEWPPIAGRHTFRQFMVLLPSQAA
jgi:hypothetical protein